MSPGPSLTSVVKGFPTSRVSPDSRAGLLPRIPYGGGLVARLPSQLGLGVEPGGVAQQVVHDLVPVGVVVGVTAEGHAGQLAVAGRGEPGEACRSTAATIRPGGRPIRRSGNDDLG
jgi:hypothetical protein